MNDTNIFRWHKQNTPVEQPADADDDAATSGAADCALRFLDACRFRQQAQLLINGTCTVAVKRSTDNQPIIGIGRLSAILPTISIGR